MKMLAANLAGAIGSRYLKNKNQLIFVEYDGFISTIDLAPVSATIISQGTTDIKGTWLFDCETGTNVSAGTTADIWWEQIDTVKRLMVPQGNAQIINLGIVDFNQITPAALQAYNYSNTAIVGNNDASNKLVNGDVFCVRTREGNYCKLMVVAYDYNLKVQWVTYKLTPTYKRIGSGYTNPEDIAVMANEQIAFVSERSGDIMKVNLASANRAAATVVCSGLTAPQQLWLDEAHMTAYVVEYANPGNLFRIDLTTGTKTALYSGLNFPVGLTLSSDLSFAYVTEQGLSGISRIELSTGIKILIAGGLTAPFFLTWTDSTESRLLVAERDPANRISSVDVTKTSNNVNLFIGNTASRPSSIVATQPGSYCVCCNSEVDQYALMASTGTGWYKGIGFVPWNLITALGKADTTTQPAYPFQFPKDSPFGGTLPVNIDHYNAWGSGIKYYKVLIDGSPRFESWNDLRLNTTNGHYDIIELQKPDINGFYSVHNPAAMYYNSDLGCLLESTTVSNGQHTLLVEFYDAAHVQVSSMSNTLLINNEKCVASLDVPLLNTHPANGCGYLKYINATDQVTLRWSAAHPQGFATWSFNIIKGLNGGVYADSGALFPAPVHGQDLIKNVSDLLNNCPGVAAFAESLYVASTVINGHSRQSQLDAESSIAFCLAP
ncbi:YncE family protein [Chitinophaga flava]|uniref:Uncharacterized protein n=1 Tax=Chitinophaga flava TaxID=2259036 RepID=A0A365XQD9_9BACT|nr:hypothetical protein [Chitinophaga flava]RBL88579.1 hypothetical protein DF182_18565 [Chitinophaga flava]